MLSQSSHAPSTLTRALVAGRYVSARCRPHPRLHTPLPYLPLLQHRNYVPESGSSPERIAIFGGGISGLASAYFIRKEFPSANITIFETAKQTGGWIRSRRVDVGNDEDVLFEMGPRTLRNATVTASLIQELGLTDQLLYTDKTEPGATNRYIYYPDRLNLLPSDIPSLSDVYALWRSGMLSGVTGLMADFFTDSRPDTLVDETVGAFVSRRFDKRLADNIISAGFHGIYAGDINQLSAKSLLGVPWELEGRYGTVLGGISRISSSSPQAVTLVHPTDYDTAKAMNRELHLDDKFARKLKNAAMMTFKDGLQSLVKRLQDAVVAEGKVELKFEAPIQHFEPVEGGMGIEVTSGPRDNPSTSTFDLAISTLRDHSLTPFVTVQTVSLFFDSHDLLPVKGFGYLIPQSIPFEQNPERALGVTFDSSTIHGQDNAFGTKVTVMMGGHWWDGWRGFPTEEEGLQAACDVLERHLNITEKPVAHLVGLARNCIPQYTLGYNERLTEFAKNMSSTYKGRLRVVGNQFNGVGINDCITGAWNLARGLRGTGWKGRSCGLDRVLDSREWVIVPRSELEYQIKGQDGGLNQGAAEGLDRRE